MRKRARAAKAMLRLGGEEDEDSGMANSGSEAEEGTSEVNQAKEILERRTRDREREKARRRLVSASFVHMAPTGEPVTTVFGDAGADPWVRIGSGLGKNAAKKAALNRDGLDERNWVVRYALATANQARAHAGKARGLRKVRLPVPMMGGRRSGCSFAFALVANFRWRRRERRK